MNRLPSLIVICILLGSCAPATIQPTATTIPSLTVTPSSTPKPTSTPSPTSSSTATAIPSSLPESIQLTFPDGLSQSDQSRLQILVNQIYWFYTGIGCSSDGFRARFYEGEGGYADVDKDGPWMEFGLGGINDGDFIGFSGGISHELAHTMCQHQFTRRSELGAIDLRWLTEGVANYFSAMEQIARNGGFGGIEMSTTDWEKDTFKAASEFCELSLSSMEPANAHEKYPDSYWTVSVGATVYLVSTTPNGISAVADYYTLLATTSKNDAFEQAFGKAKEVFYQEYQSDCDRGFPILVQ